MTLFMKDFQIPTSWLRLYFCAGLLLTLLCNQRGFSQSQPVSLTIRENPTGPALAPDFLGLSFEISKLLPQNDHYYFNTNDRALMNTFKTLGIHSLRVGANAVDDPEIPVPQTKDIDNFFNFARAVDARVIYSFRLKNGDINESARLAAHIAAHHAGVLDCFSIGNEPNFYLKTFPEYFSLWKQQYDAIVHAVPDAKFIGPSVANAPPAKQNYYPLELAKVMAPAGHLAVASDHYYFLGRRNDLEKDPAASRAMLLSDHVHATYDTAYSQIGAKLATRGMPYRIDELNNCARGGARESSDTYAAALWALDCTHWWAGHHILGMNYHTGEFLQPDGTIGASSYSAFVHLADGRGLNVRPQGYAYLAFTEGARGRPLTVNLKTAPSFDFDAYAYQGEDRSFYVTLINKSYGDHASNASVSINMPSGINARRWQRMDLKQQENDPAAKSEIAFGGSPIDSQGNWHGRWLEISNAASAKLVLEVGAASATVIRFSDSIEPMTQARATVGENQ
jgi:hypothetical protein